MRRLTHGRMNRNGLSKTKSRSNTLLSSSVLPSTWAGRALALLFAPIPLAMLGAGCGSDPVGVKVGPSIPGVETIDPEDTGLIERCGEDGIICGTGCCRNGNTCAFERCVPSVECTSSDQCSADSQCSARTCSPWSVLPVGAQFSSSCRNSID